jgi:hypothetical protein
VSLVPWSARRDRRRLAAAGLLLLAFATGCGPRAQDAAGEPVRCAADDGPCVGSGSGGLQLSFEIAPRPVRSRRDLTFRVEARLAGRPVLDETVAVDLRMPGMAMGTNRVLLSPRGEGRYEGAGVIVRCPSGGRGWEAAVTSRSIPGVRFAFEVDRP